MTTLYDRLMEIWESASQGAQELSDVLRERSEIIVNADDRSLLAQQMMENRENLARIARNVIAQASPEWREIKQFLAKIGVTVDFEKYS